MCKAAKQASWLTVCSMIAVGFLFSAMIVHAGEAEVTGSNMNDVLRFGRDLAIVCLILIAFMTTMWKIVNRFSNSIDNMKDALAASAFTNASNVANLIAAAKCDRDAIINQLKTNPCFATQIIQDAMKGELAHIIQKAAHKAVEHEIREQKGGIHQ